MSKITSMNFLQPVIIGGRAVTSLGEHQGYVAEFLDFPWVRVVSRVDPGQRRRTTVFNVRDCEDFEDAPAAPEVPDGDAKSVSPRNRRG